MSPSLTDIPPTILSSDSPKPIIDWLAPMKIPLHVKRTLFRLWAHATEHNCTLTDFTLIRTAKIDNR